MAIINVYNCRDLLALNVYLAMCYHKLDYYDVSQVSISHATVASAPPLSAGGVIRLCTTSS